MNAPASESVARRAGRRLGGARWRPSRGHASDPWFYFRYDLAWAAALGGLVVVLRAHAWPGLEVPWTAACAALPIAGYLMVLAHVLVHNAAHQTMPPWINAVVGELLGAVVLTRFASWEILHQRHHQHPDDPARDPHPVQASFLRFLVCEMLGNLEANLHQQFLERHGDTPAHRLRTRVRTALSFSTMLLLLLTWYTLIGPVGFFGLFLPSAGFALLFVAHFNWVTHGGPDRNSPFGPRDLDHGIYGLLNRALFGLYMHASHHADPSHFDPRRARLARGPKAGSST